ncbi:radical SAM protein [Hydrogenothermus marinus]|uniref:23S rRNA (Adenine2503-C2)-methyltransferase n=1 Tax=Hydrogenothermus marinus TaxID=133270 RepID=A0A3M0BKE8_9AQUI|nr:23S rRNA (adenine2503-C2)-methyltransferase [Hydrogenothermus marinus]
MIKIKEIINDDINKLFELETDDNFTIESVFYRGNTLCVSSQVGCPIKCLFCASGMKGLIRNLTFEEIIQQYENAEKENITNITFAGIGEPLLNWENVQKAFWYFKEKGLKVSFYTTGFPLKNFKQLLNLPHNGVSLSLHAVSEENRKKLIPKSASIDKLISILKEHTEKLSNRKRKLYSLAYLLIKDINDSKEELDRLAEIAKELKFSISLLKYNEIEGIPYKTTTDEDYEKTFLYLKNKGLKITLSNKYRTRKIGGCGTLMINRLKS